MAQKLLIGTLGTRNRSCKYQLSDGGAVVEAASTFAALAVSPLQFDRKVALVTREARKVHEADLAALGAELVDLPDGRTVEEIWQVFRVITGVAQAGDQVTLDLTGGLRSLPAITLAALQFLDATRGVNLQGALYGALEASDAGGVVPIFDLAPMLSIVRWAADSRAYAKSGSLDPLAESFASAARAIRKDDHARKLSEKPLIELAKQIRAPAPVEAGMSAWKLRATLESLGSIDGRPDGAALLAATRPVIEELLALAPAVQPVDAKSKVPLTKDELQRHLHFAHWLAGHGRILEALLVLEEWLISHAVLASGDTARWLDWESRQPANRRLQLLEHRRDDRIPEELRQVKKFRLAIAGLRNSLAHAGMRPEPVKAPDEIDTLLDRADCLQQMADSGWNRLWQDGERTLLIAPLGMSPGVLLTALHHVRPEALLVFTSKQARAGGDKALQEADFKGTVRWIELPDPFSDFPLDRQAMKDRCGGVVEELAAQVDVGVASLAGGTTALQLWVEAAASYAERAAGLEVTRGVCIDRREATEQKEKPWVIGEWRTLPADS